MVEYVPFLDYVHQEKKKKTTSAETWGADTGGQSAGEDFK